MGKFLDEYKNTMKLFEDCRKGLCDFSEIKVKTEQSALRLQDYLFELKFLFLDRIYTEMHTDKPDGDLIVKLSKAYDILGGVDFAEPD